MIMRRHLTEADRKAPPYLARLPIPSGTVTRSPAARRYRTRGLGLPLFEVEHRGVCVVFWLVRRDNRG
jgi:hypothetical protein